MKAAATLETITNTGALLRRPPADAVAVRLPHGDVTYGELRETVDRAAAGLAEGGVGHGTRVMIRVGDDLSRLILGLAAQQLGAVSLAINPATIGAELEFMVVKSDPGAVIADADLAGPVGSIAGAGIWINERGALTARRPCAISAPPAEPDGEDPASLLFTSGSSATPRLAVLPHRSHVAMAVDFAGLIEAGPEDSFLCLSPLFHVAGWSTAVLPAIASGASLVMPGNFSASRFWADVERWKPTIWTTGLAFIEMVAARGGEPPAKTPFRHVISNLRPDTFELGRKQLGLPLGTYYGLTENNGRGTIALGIEDYEAGFVGSAYTESDAVRVVRDGRTLGPGEVGEIELHGDSVMSGYFRDPEATAAVLRPGRWVATGDLGRLDESGNLYFKGRIKNMIKRSGENVSAEEVELLLLEHDAIVDAIVVAVPDRVREEEIKAIVVLAADAELTPEEVRRYCSGRVADFKVPRYVQIEDSIPRTVSGKPDIGTIRRTMATPDGAWDGAEQRTYTQATNLEKE
jgi:acyl-CoA synthetase (AMP-forming)/AMP-acid ligase II